MHSMQRTVQWNEDMAATEGGDCWDDTELLELFDEAVKSHSIRGQGKKRARTGSHEKYHSFHDDDIAPASNGVGRKRVSFPSEEAALQLPAAHPAEGCSPHERLEQLYSSEHGPQPTEPPSAAPCAVPVASLTDYAPHGAELQGALTDMLHAWYQSGYTTGRYHTLLALQAKAPQTQDPDPTQHSSNFNSKIYTGASGSAS